MRDGCDGSTLLLGDIFAVASDDADHDRKLDAVRHRLFEHGATINFDNAESGVDQQHFIGFSVSNVGGRPV